MGKVFFSFALHFHQPIGNFEYIFERAYKFCYDPLLKLISEYPGIKMMFHISGCLLDYLDKEHPEAIDLIGRMVSNRQIEMMSGGYYEPILVSIPERDIIGQINMMTSCIKRRFKVLPEGMWTAERVWDPALTDVLYASGIRYVVLDNAHLVRSGIKEEDVCGYFLTGRDRKIAVFPSDKNLRYMIPFLRNEDILDYFRYSYQKKGNCLRTYGDDAEKFGEWPGTYTHVFKNGWLRSFFNMLDKNKDEIESVHFSDYLQHNPPAAEIDVQQGSYAEMMEWSGGSWLNFFSKYPESDHMHNKMLYISSKVENAVRKSCSKDIGEARKELFKGQCNCAYWHGVFGGLYLYHLRKAVYEHLIKADKIIDKAVHKSKKAWLDMCRFDFGKGDKEEVVIENKDVSLYIAPDEGGIIKELDYKYLSCNLVNTLSRRKEDYHQKLLASSKQTTDLQIATIHEDFRKIDPGLKDIIFYDRYTRTFLRSYFVKRGTGIEDFMKADYEEIGDFSTGVYSVKQVGANGRSPLRGVILHRRSIVSDNIIDLYKEIKIGPPDIIKIASNIKSSGPVDKLPWFCLEFNVTMPDLNSPRYCYFADNRKQAGLDDYGICSPVSSFGIQDAGSLLSMYFYYFKRPDRVYYFPVKTVSQSERAYELNYQCSCMLFLWDLRKDSEYKIEMDFVLKRG